MNLLISLKDLERKTKNIFKINWKKFENLNIQLTKYSKPKEDSSKINWEMESSDVSSEHSKYFGTYNFESWIQEELNLSKGSNNTPFISIVCSNLSFSGFGMISDNGDDTYYLNYFSF